MGMLWRRIYAVASRQILGTTLSVVIADLGFLVHLLYADAADA